MTTPLLWLAIAVSALSGPLPQSEAPAPCTAAPYDMLEPFVGVWHELTVTPEGERLEGTLEARYVLGGCAFQQTFEAASGAFRFQTLGRVDASSGRWVETYVFDDGRSATYAWSVEGSDVMQYPIDPDRRRDKRLRLTDVSADAYFVVDERSEDGGATWRRVEVTATRRVE